MEEINNSSEKKNLKNSLVHFLIFCIPVLSNLHGRELIEKIKKRWI